MVFLVHGNDTLASRTYFLSKKDKNSFSFNAEDLNFIELNQVLNGSSIFPVTKNIFIENFFTRKALTNQKEIIKALSVKSEIDIYIYSDKEENLKTLSEIKNLDQNNFKIPQNLWNFLDAIRPNNYESVLNFHNALKGSDPEFIFAMLLRQFRLLIAISSVSINSIVEIKRLAPWQKSKLASQASLFNEYKLVNILKKLYVIDKSIKTGKSNLTLIQNIDILLLEI
jgi:hypothetical protein